MADEYRPRSPDLSAPVPEEPHPQHRYRGSLSHILTTPTESKSAFSFETPGHLHQHQQIPHPPPPQFNNFSFGNNNNNAPYNPFTKNQSPPQQQQQQDHIMKHEEEYVEDEEYRPESKQRPTPRAKKVKTEASEMGNGAPNNAPGVAEGIEVKTKFPVARIKRIMQADEDVGKVAQVTPVAVSKALELFMISLVTKAASEARARGSKRVTSAHLKQAVQKEEQFDFLTEIVSKVPDAPAPRAKDEDSDEPMDGVGKKKRAAPRRKRKGSDEF